MDSSTNIAKSCFYQHQLPCGMMLLGQTMPWLRSASFALNIPAGSQVESPDDWGLAGMVCEMVQRGAGPHSSRDVIALADNLGIDRSASVTTAHTILGGSMPAESLHAALELFCHVVRRPHLPADQLEDARSLALQELRAAEDEPVQRVMMRLRERHYGEPLGHTNLGTTKSLHQIDSNSIREFFTRHYQPQGAVLSIAGSFDWEATVSRVEELFSGWPVADAGQAPAVDHLKGYDHITHPSQQTHIGFSFPSVPYGSPDYFTLRAAIGVLSDGMSSRLFDRVREQRGLCYTVSASAHSLRGAGGVFGYAGTTPERAQETLDVTWAEILQLGHSVLPDELERFKVRIQSQLVMQQESSSSRASALSTDWYHLGRTLQPEEIEARMDAVTPEDIAKLWDSLDFKDACFVTLGPQPLKLPEGCS